MRNPFAAPPVDPDEVTMRINGKKWRFFDDVEITRSADSYSTATFKAPWDPTRKELRETFRPLSYQFVEIWAGNDLLFTGKMLVPAPNREENIRSVTATCYALPGVLHDSDAPVSLLPFESRGLTLLQIARPLCKPFGFDAVAEGDVGAPFKRVKQKLDGKVQPFLVDLAQQRGFILTDTPGGDVRIWKSTDVGRPVASFVQGQPPVLSIQPTFDPHQYFSEITGVVGEKVTRRGSKYSEKNPRLTGELRCQTFKIKRADKADAPTAVRARMGRMFGNAFSVSVEVPTWRDPSGKLWHANTTVKLKAPDAMVYTDYEFIARTVSFRKNANAQTATLSLVLPGAFSGEVPATMPWDEP